MKTSVCFPRGLVLAAAIGLTACNNSVDRLVTPFFIGPPTVVTSPPSEVTPNAAALSGKIVSTGYGNISESGILIYPADGSVERQMLAANPADSERYYSDNASDADFALYIRNLLPNTSYHYMAFATNEAGTAYGEMKELVTSYGTVDDSEGNMYQTIKIGDQLWMRENLKTTIYSDGSKIKGFYESSEDGTFGKHYTWQAAMGMDYIQTPARDVCPTGWHLPSDADWQKLLTYTGVPSGEFKTIGAIGDNQAAMLKESATGYWKNEDINNSTGFSVLPAGVVPEKGDKFGPLTAFWTSTPYVYYGFQKGSEKIVRGNDPDSKAYLSVRCLKD